MILKSPEVLEKSLLYQSIRKDGELMDREAPSMLAGQGASSTRRIPSLGLQLFHLEIGPIWRLTLQMVQCLRTVVVEGRQEDLDIADQTRYWAGDLLISLVPAIYI
ncbi:MAG TPA: hypothetical protein VE641_18880 [Chthoniobacterales bacterium]|nr:hypothetical protein [Chthoniobacterales bacterium]